MASLFLSYAREDAKTAQRIAGSLEAAGHRVWWDRHVHAGSRFSSEIDAATPSCLAGIRRLPDGSLEYRADASDGTARWLSLSSPIHVQALRTIRTITATSWWFDAV